MVRMPSGPRRAVGDLEEVAAVGSKQSCARPRQRQREKASYPPHRLVAPAAMPMVAPSSVAVPPPRVIRWETGADQMLVVVEVVVVAAAAASMRQPTNRIVAMVLCVVVAVM